MSGKNEVELKGGMYTFMSLKLRTADLSIIDQRIADKVQQAPGFFKDSPVVVDLSGLEEELEDGANVDTAELFDRIRSHNLIPVVASVSDKSSPFAASIALPLMETGAKRGGKAKSSNADNTNTTNDTNSSSSSSGSAVSLISGNPGNTSKNANKSASNADSKESDSSEDESDEVEAELAAATEVQVIVKAPMLLRRPVRSGQQVYARDTDLIIMGQVGAGAEVLADNNIHVYGPLRGRALCGVSGNSNTRIFCQSLEAEVVSVDGIFRVLEEIPADLRGKPAQIWLNNGKLNIEPLVETNLSGVIA